MVSECCIWPDVLEECLGCFRAGIGSPAETWHIIYHYGMQRHSNRRLTLCELTLTTASLCVIGRHYWGDNRRSCRRHHHRGAVLRQVPQEGRAACPHGHGCCHASRPAVRTVQSAWRLSSGDPGPVMLRIQPSGASPTCRMLL